MTGRAHESRDQGRRAQGLVQEIKANRRLQVGLAALPVLVYLLWPSSPPARDRRGAAPPAAPAWSWTTARRGSCRSCPT